MRFFVLLFFSLIASAQSSPQPPCGMPPVPAYPAPGQSLSIKVWTEADTGRDWKPPACTGWTTTGYTSLVTVSGEFRGSDLLRRIQAVSELAGIRYWSTTHKKWQTLIVEAHPLSTVTGELKQGQTLDFEQTDNLSGKGTYRMRMLEVSENRIVYSVENTSTMHYFLVTTFHPGDLQAIYFFDRQGDGTWRYYNMVRTGKNANRLTAGHEASSVNRAVALYRHWAGIPTDQEPPAAR